MLTTSELKSFLLKNKLHLSKRLGQNHLIDAWAVRRIVDAAELQKDETVVEIGAGLGALTEKLADRAKQVIAVEVDSRFAKPLSTRLKDISNIKVVCEDITKFDWSKLSRVVVVGAIPYSITSPIIVALSQAHRSIRRAILVMQKEVAQRLVAIPSTKAYGRLSVLAQYFWKVEKVAIISRSAFFPQPGVDSSCIRFRVWAKPPVKVNDESAYLRFVASAFSQRRKTLVNCLTDALGKSKRASIETAILSCGHTTSVRAEALSLMQLANIASILDERAN